MWPGGLDRRAKFCELKEKPLDPCDGGGGDGGGQGFHLALPTASSVITRLGKPE